jgi:hypothetical protein
MAKRALFHSRNQRRRERRRNYEHFKLPREQLPRTHIRPQRDDVVFRLSYGTDALLFSYLDISQTHTIPLHCEVNIDYYTNYAYYGTLFLLFDLNDTNDIIQTD